MSGKSTTTIPSKPIEKHAPLSLAQQRLWFIYQLDPLSSTYNISRAWRFTGSLDTSALESSINTVLSRHRALHTVFQEIDGETVQIIQPMCPFTLQPINLSSHAPDSLENEIHRMVYEEPLKPFNLTNGPLFRITFLQSGPNNYVLIFSVHHIVFDGTSLKIFCQELSQCYQTYLQGRPIQLPSLFIEYQDFAYWQQGDLIQQKVASQRTFWKAQLEGAPLDLEFPSEALTSNDTPGQGNVQTFSMAERSISRLKAMIQPQGISLFMGLLAVFQILLARYTGQRDLVVGTPIAGRTQRDLEGLIGFFVNTIVLRMQLQDLTTFRDALQQLRTTCLHCYRHSDFPFEKIVELLNPVRHSNRHPVIQAIFQLRKASDNHLQLSGLEVQPFLIKRRTGNFDVHMVCEETATGLEGHVYYSPLRYSDRAMANFIQHYQILLDKVLADPDCPIQQLSFLTETETCQQTVEWNVTTTSDLQPRSLASQLEDQAKIRPDTIVAICGDAHLTYANLTTRANQLAHHLIALGVGLEVPVALYCERSLDLLVGLWGIIKSGGAYVPVDPDYPKKRIAWILQDSEAAIIVAQRHTKASLPPNSPTVVWIDTDWPKIERNPLHAPSPLLSVDNLAYILYTSGSTGKPKGVMVTHQGLLNYLQWSVQTFEVHQGQGTIVHSSIGFDLTVTSLFCPLLVGSKVQLLSQSGDIQELVSLLRNNWGLSFLKITPAHLEALNHLLLPEEMAGRIRTLIIGGEALPRESLAAWHHFAPQTTLYNEYGPTETVVGCCIYNDSSSEVKPGTVPIGRPIANTRIYLLNPYLHLSPVGVIGELYIAGEGLARGYIHQPDLTAQRFIPEFFSDQWGTRQYRSGDRARYQSGGDLEFFGRSDHQIKVRGYRIELQEIEETLRQHPQVHASVVVCREDHPGEKKLVAYVTTKQPPFKPALLHNYLHDRLPGYMIPQAFIELPHLALTLNGKVDREALPKPEETGRINQISYEAPTTLLEETLVAIWQKVLDVKKIGVHDNFFELGGHSLLATQVVSRIRKEWGVELNLKMFFEVPTIRGLAKGIEGFLWIQTGAAKKDSSNQGLSDEGII